MAPRDTLTAASLAPFVQDLLYRTKNVKLALNLKKALLKKIFRKIFGTAAGIRVGMKEVAENIDGPQFAKTV
ncbi:hypothetical protein [Pseudopelagicola sp. nBUS_19]|uniref:hypothetical protein n=1 Tax=unclassified Pseudopelagicola TaxID=2649563 RepID=UPI003EBFBA90